MPPSPSQTGTAHNIGKTGIQTSQIQVPGAEEGESGGQVGWSPKIITVRDAHKEPVEDL